MCVFLPLPITLKSFHYSTSFLKHDLSLMRVVIIDGEGLGSEIRGDLLLISSLLCCFNF